MQTQRSALERFTIEGDELGLEEIVREHINLVMTSTATALSTLLTGHAVTTAPPALVSAVITTSLTTLTATSTIGLMTLFSASSVKWIALTATVVGLTTSVVIQMRNSQHLRTHNSELAQELELTRAQLKQLQVNSDSLSDEFITLRENQAELQRLRGQVAELHRKVAAANTPPEPASLTAAEAPKVVVFGEVQGVIPLIEGQAKRLSEGLAELPRSEVANFRHVLLYRFDPVAGATTTNLVNVDQIWRAGDPSQDLVLMGGDRIEVRPRMINF